MGPLRVRVHPENPCCDLSKKLKQASLPPDKFFTASEKEARVNLEPLQIFANSQRLATMLNSLKEVAS